MILKNFNLNKKMEKRDIYLKINKKIASNKIKQRYETVVLGARTDSDDRNN